MGKQQEWQVTLAKSGKPNIIFIVLDTLRRDGLSAYGNPRETSPHLDQFSEGATLFTHAIAPAQWTTPSHISMFTGLYPSMHRVTQGDSQLASSICTLPELLSKAGYTTIAFSNNPLVGVLDNGLRRGFDHFYNYAGAAPNRPLDLNNSGLQRAVTERFRRLARRMENQFARSDRLFSLSMLPWLVPLWTRLINYKGHTRQSINDTIDYWRLNANGSARRPLFVFLNLMGSHLPYNPARESVGRVAPELVNDKHAHAFIRRFNTDAARWSCPPDPPLRDWQRLTLKAFHNAEIASQDVHLGSLLRGIAKPGSREKTLVIIAADHGEVHGNHDFFGHGFSVHQELVHVPLIIYGNPFPAGKIVSQTVSTRRIFHTVLEAAEVNLAQQEKALESRAHLLSLSHLAHDSHDAEMGIAFSEAFPPRTILSMLQRRNPQLIDRLKLDEVHRALHDGGNKLIVIGKNVDALYNIDEDPAEKNNLKARYPDLVETLHERMGPFLAASKVGREEQSVTLSAEMKEHLRTLGYMN